MKLDEKKCVDDEFSQSLKSSLHCTHVRRELNSVWRETVSTEEKSRERWRIGRKESKKETEFSDSIV